MMYYMKYFLHTVVIEFLKKMFALLDKYMRVENQSSRKLIVKVVKVSKEAA